MSTSMLPFFSFQTLFFIIVPAPRPEKIHRMRFQYALRKLPSSQSWQEAHHAV